MSGRPVHHAAVHKPAALWVISPMFGAGFPQWEHNATFNLLTTERTESPQALQQPHAHRVQL